MTEFNYLGHIFTATDDDWPVSVVNLKNSRKKWAAAVKNYGTGWGGRADFGHTLQGIGPSRLALLIGDVGGEPLYRQDTGGIPPQGVPTTNGEATS